MNKDILLIHPHRVNATYQTMFVLTQLRVAGSAGIDRSELGPVPNLHSHLKNLSEFGWTIEERDGRVYLGPGDFDLQDREWRRRVLQGLPVDNLNLLRVLLILGGLKNMLRGEGSALGDPRECTEYGNLADHSWYPATMCGLWQ